MWWKPHGPQVGVPVFASVGPDPAPSPAATLQYCYLYQKQLRIIKPQIQCCQLQSRFFSQLGAVGLLLQSQFFLRHLAARRTTDCTQITTQNVITLSALIEEKRPKISKFLTAKILIKKGSLSWTK
jgi:hypothetical protein